MTASGASALSMALPDSARRAKDEEDDSEYEELIPPENFAMIEKGLYRSTFSRRRPLLIPLPCSS